MLPSRAPRAAATGGPADSWAPSQVQAASRSRHPGCPGGVGLAPFWAWRWGVAVATWAMRLPRLFGSA
eukprot:10442399-Alexandrium_andersonii.AAC.1